MSYSRSYSATISGTVSKSVSYPASQKGGSTDVSLDWQEDVEVTIFVDTSPFDDSVATIKQHVGALTGAMVATQSVHVAQKIKAARAISDSVTKGFFTVIGSNISQQMAEAKSKIDSLLLSLADLKQSLLKIHQQMGHDYARISERYGRIFEDLDKETQNRIGALDAALFRTRESLAQPAERTRGKGGSVVPTIVGGENSQSQSAMVTGSIRARMNRLLGSAAAFLGAERQLAHGFQEILADEVDQGSPQQFLPVLYMEAEGVGGMTTASLLASDFERNPLLQLEVRSKLVRHFMEGSLPWSSSGRHPQVERHLSSLVDGLQSGDAVHAARVRAAILKCWSASKPSILPC
jgi:hypothetical protein